MDDERKLKQIEDAVKEYGKIIEQLPPPPKVDTDTINIPFETCVCGKKILMTHENLETLNTGVFTCLNDVCKGCTEGHKIDKKFARIVCAKCKRVICRIDPHKDPITKFEFVAGRSYHLAECALCTPSEDGQAKEYPIIEVKLWKQKNNIS